MEELCFLTVSQSAAAIRQQRVTSVEVVEAHLAQITSRNPELNAFIAVDEEGARNRARSADEALAQGEWWGPLHGVPFSLKDVHDTAGVLSTMGFPAFKERVAVDDNLVAARLKAAGGILLGKTNTQIFPDNPFGRTKNPWDLERSPGTSSSGSVTAVATGMSPLDVGSDGLGSITVPAHFTGVFGFRPTERRVPVGTFPTDPFPIWRCGLVLGPISRSAVDLRLAMAVLAGPDPGDMDAVPLEWRAVPRPQLHDLRIAWATDFQNTIIEEDIEAAIRDLIEQLSRRGAHLEEKLPDVDFVTQSKLGRRFFQVSGGAMTPHGLLRDYFKVLQEREAFIFQWEGFFREYDVFLCPALQHTARYYDQSEAEIGDGVDIHALCPVTGSPAVVIPIGRDRKGLPIGVQLIGPRYDDERLLEIADLIAEVSGGFQRPPGY